MLLQLSDVRTALSSVCSMKMEQPPIQVRIPSTCSMEECCPSLRTMGERHQHHCRCPSLGSVACASIRAKYWRRGITVSVVPTKTVPSIIRTYLDPSAIVWGSAALATFALWGCLVWCWWPSSWSSTPKLVEHGLTFCLHIVFMDLVPNWLTGLCLHRIPFLERWEHRWEHRTAKAGTLSSIFLVATLYAWYALLFMAAIGLGVACTSPAQAGCFHWESIMWLASFSYALVGLILRVIFWVARQIPSTYRRHPLLLKMSRFYWAHFHFHEWSGGVVFGACTPFYDVVFGTCPFDIKWSTPIPFIDFLVCEDKVFETVRHPRKMKWTVWQRVWHIGWLALIVGAIALLTSLQAIGYFEE